MASLTSYHGIQVLTPPPMGDGGLAIQNDFKSLVDWHPKSVWSETADPTVTDDDSEDFYPGSFWLRTNTTPPRLFLCQSSATSAAVWVPIPFRSSAVATKTAAWTIVAADSVLLCDATSAAFTLTLPSASATGISGCQFTIKRINSGSNNVTLAAASGQTIDGAATYVLNTQYQTARVVSNGSDWFLV